MYKLNKQNPIVKKLIELDDVISEYFALKHCHPESSSSSEISETIGPGRGLVKSIIDYENAPANDKKDGNEYGVFGKASVKRLEEFEGEAYQ
jgi:hypothetical protein